jgi:hypothetical protein
MTREMQSQADDKCGKKQDEHDERNAFHG